MRHRRDNSNPQFKQAKPKNFAGTIKRMIGQMKRGRFLLYIAMIFAISSSLISIFAPKQLSNLVDRISIGVMDPANGVNMSVIRELALLILFMYIVSGLLSFLQSIIMSEISNNFARDLRKKVSGKINTLPLNYFDKHQTGDILSRITNDVDSIAMNLNQSLATLGVSITMLIGTLIMIFITNWILALVLLASSLISMFFLFIILGKSQGYFKLRQKQLGDINGLIEEMYSGINIVRVYNAKEKTQVMFDELNNQIYKSNLMSKFLSGLLDPIFMFIGNLGYVAVSIVGAVMASKGMITFGVIVAFMSYVRLFLQPLAQVSQSMQSMQSAVAAGERVFEFLDEQDMKDETNLVSNLNPQKVQGKIEFKDVEFTYPANEKPTINNFSATALPGQKIAIVGPTGAGKSTMVNLLMKFYEISNGDILIDGVSIHDIKREEIHNLFTMVLQDSWVFKGSIRENIVYNKKDVSEDKLNTLAEFIGLKHFINTLPEGFDTEISESESISQGQRQLLTIARGMLKDAPFLILDEATSNVDTRTEEVVQEAMDKLMSGRTSFIIAHRLSTIVNSDLILVMNEGNIIESGTHEELLSKNGFYSELYNSQFSL